MSSELGDQALGPTRKGSTKSIKNSKMQKKTAQNRSKWPIFQHTYLPGLPGSLPGEDIFGARGGPVPGPPFSPALHT